MANQLEGATHGRVESIVQAVELLSPEAVHALATRARTFDFFERTSVWDSAPERFRLHGIATQRAAERLAAEVNYEHRDRLMVTALLHDIGKLVLLHAYPGYPGQVHGAPARPEERIHRERRELGVDHALVGGVLARRWGLPEADRVGRSSAITPMTRAARPRSCDWPTCSPTTAQGAPVAPDRAAEDRARDRHGPGRAAARDVRPARIPTTGRTRQVDPCPLSAREVEVLKRLAEGKVYKQIALRAVALHEHRAHAPAQHLRQARRGRPRARPS